ncbi:MAG TPA: trypsin-like peptidase domain-containing protein [Candidatus Dojkabacteria bacterium]|nr:trypsin-like peptidase domain-containing protein [Candidatus Dojkabacteria bacterium]
MANNNRTEEVKKSQNEILDISDSSTNIRVTNENDDVVSTLEYADKRAQDAIEEQEKKEQTIKQKKKPTKTQLLIRKILLIVGVILVLVLIGFIVGLWVYPKGYGWLKDHNFIKTDGANTENPFVGYDKLNREIVSEESTIIDVVRNTQDSVVSIAVAELSLGQDGSTESNSIGSGFIVGKDGLIATNQHVVAQLNQNYVVVTSDGKQLPVESILRDDVNDIAIIKVNASDLNALTLGDSEQLTQGQLVIAIGTPLGEYAGSVTTGVISGLNRKVVAGNYWGTGVKNYENVIQTDAAINPGNSGGPLLNSKGEVVGVNFATTSNAENISFSIPINIVSSRLEEYRKYGKFIKPYLGIQYDIISELDAIYYKNVVAGALVQRVVPGSPAEKAGIVKSDIVTEINGIKVENSVSYVIQKFKVGDEITIKVWRNGQVLELKTVLDESD